MGPNKIFGLYAILDTASVPEPSRWHAAEAALRAGGRALQYRDKTTDAERRLREARALAALCRVYDAPFIVNDDIELTLAAKADGVHLGRGDAAVPEARSRLGPDRLIGVSCYNELERALAAQREGADYVAFGAVYPSATKPNAVLAPLELFRATREKITLPIVAIGGLTAENGAAVLKAGADALAVIDGVFGQPDIFSAADRLAALFG